MNGLKTDTAELNELIRQVRQIGGPLAGPVEKLAEMVRHIRRLMEELSP